SEAGAPCVGIIYKVGTEEPLVLENWSTNRNDKESGVRAQHRKGVGRLLGNDRTSRRFKFECTDVSFSVDRSDEAALIVRRKQAGGICRNSVQCRTACEKCHGRSQSAIVFQRAQLDIVGSETVCAFQRECGAKGDVVADINYGAERGLAGKICG